MKPLDYLNKYRKEIINTARYIAQVEYKDSEIILDDLTADYKNNNGSYCSETVIIDKQTISISPLLKHFRDFHISEAHVYVYAEDEFYEIYHRSGDQFSCVFLIEEITQKIAEFLYEHDKVFEVKLYICHNKPFMYKAEPYNSDQRDIENIIRKINDYNSTSNYIKLTLLDYAIVTTFDYWSLEQDPK